MGNDINVENNNTTGIQKTYIASLAAKTSDNKDIVIDFTDLNKSGDVNSGDTVTYKTVDGKTATAVVKSVERRTENGTNIKVNDGHNDILFGVKEKSLQDVNNLMKFEEQNILQSGKETTKIGTEDDSKRQDRALMNQTPENLEKFEARVKNFFGDKSEAALQQAIKDDPESEKYVEKAKYIKENGDSAKGKFLTADGFRKYIEKPMAEDAVKPFDKEEIQ